MKTKRKILALALLVTICLISLALAQPPANQTMPPAMGMPPSATPATRPMTMDDVVVQAVIGDLPGFLNRVDALGQQLNPNRPADQSLKAKLGAVLNDPTLSGFTPESGAVVLMFPDQVSALLVEAAPEQLQKYKDTVTSMGMVMADTSEGLLVVSKSQAGVTAGKAVAAQAKTKFLAAPGKPEADVTLLVPKILAKYQPMIDQVIQSVPMMMSMKQQQQGGQQQDFAASQKQAQAMELQLRGIDAAARQINVLKLNLQIPDDAVRLNFAAVPKPGTDLASLSATPIAEGINLTQMLPAKGSIRGTLSYNPDAVFSLLQKQATAIFQKMTMPPADQQTILSTLQTAKAAYAGQTAADFFVPGQGLVSGSVLNTVKDPQAAWTMLEKTSQITSGTATQGTTGMGIKGQFKRNVKQYKGLEIGQITIKSQGTAPAGQSMPNINATFDVAIVDNIMIQTTGPGAIEQMIDAVQAKSNPNTKALTAAAKFPAGANLYADIDLGGFLSALAPTLQSVPMAADSARQVQATAAKLKGAPPVSMAGYADKEGLRMTTIVPKDIIARFGSGAKAAPAAPAAPAPAPGGAL